MKTREEIITSMCYTYKHDFGINYDVQQMIPAGTTPEQREHIRNTMSQIFDNDIAPYMEFKDNKTSNMNPLIEKFARRAGFDSYNYQGGNAEPMTKFAHLIIQECIKIPHEMWYESQLNAEVSTKIENRIKEHFGVNSENPMD